MATLKIEDRYVCTLDDDTLKKCKDELKEDPAQRDSCIQTLRDWCIAQPHLNSRLDDGFLLRYLRVGKFSQLRAQQMIDKYWTAKTEHPDWFKYTLQNENVQKLIKLGIFVPLKTRDALGRRICMTRYAEYDPYALPLDDVVQYSFMACDVLLADEMSQIHGIVFVEDAAGLKAAHLTLWTKDVMSKMMGVFQDAYPMRIKQAHYINMGVIFNTMWEMFKYFMKEKLRKRLKMHWSMDALYAEIPKKLLPEEYGGDAGPIQEHIDAFAKEVNYYRPDLDLNNEARFGVDESKRIKTKKKKVPTATLR